MANVTAFRRLLAFPLSIHRLQHTNQSPGSPTRTPAWVSIETLRVSRMASPITGGFRKRCLLTRS